MYKSLDMPRHAERLLYNSNCHDVAAHLICGLWVFDELHSHLFSRDWISQNMTFSSFKKLRAL